MKIVPSPKEQAFDYLNSDQVTGITLYFGHTQKTATMPDGSYCHGQDILELANKLREYLDADKS